MKHMSVALLLGCWLALPLTGVAVQTPPAAARSVLIDGKYKVTVTSTHRAGVMPMFPGNDAGPKMQPGPGMEFFVVTIEVRSAATGAVDDDASFEKFSVEDLDGKTYKGAFETTDLRGIPFAVPIGTKLKTFSLSGATIPLGSLGER